MNSSKLYVGGLPYATTENELEDLFAEHGTVESVRVITDRMTGRSKGFGFVEMGSQEEAEAAIEKLNNLSSRAGLWLSTRPSPVKSEDHSAAAAREEIAGNRLRY